MADPIRALLDGARNRQTILEKSVFRAPPATMEAFNQLLGRWLELEETSNWLQEILRRDDEDDEK